MMKEIGGYFGIEYTNVQMGHLHDGAIRLNSARSCLAYILLARSYKHIYIPYYICDVVPATIAFHNVSFTFYHINEQLEPVEIPTLKADEAFLYVNYFGLKDTYTKQLAEKINNLIIDNSQALFNKALPGIDTFYSLRKFMGVAHGGFLYTNATASINVPDSDSSATVAHLYKRADVNAFAGYSTFQENEHALETAGLQQMSASVQQFLKTYDFEKNISIRERNFLFLHLHLARYNKAGFIAPAEMAGPMCYPFLTSTPGLRQQLINHKIFVGTYWPGIETSASLEQELVSNLLPLPVDHRYDLNDMKYIIDTIMLYLADNI